MISRKYKCIFVHIPKCAGTSIENVLRGVDGSEHGFEQNHASMRVLEKPFPNQFILSSKENALEVLRRVKSGKGLYTLRRDSEVSLSTEEFENYFKFAFVRNPWSRAYSWYKNVVRDEFHQKNLGVGADIQFSDFLAAFIGKGMLRPQTYWLKNFRGDICLDFIGKFENLSSDFEVVKEALGLTDRSLPHKLHGGNNTYHNAYDQHSREMVASYYQDEIKLFGYKFE